MYVFVALKMRPMSGREETNVPPYCMYCHSESPVPLVPSRFTSLGHLHYCTLAYLKVGKVIRTFTKGS